MRWFGIAATVAAGISAPAGGPGDAAVVVLQAQAEAWSRGDLDAFCSAYADDAVFVTPTGVTRGKYGVLERYRKKYPDKKAMGTLRLAPLDVRLLPDAGAKSVGVAVVAKWTLAYPDKPEASGHTLVVMRPRGAGWEIVQDASM